MYSAALRVCFDKSSYDRSNFVIRQYLCDKFDNLMETVFFNPASQPGAVQQIIGFPRVGKTFLVQWFAETYEHWYD